MDPEDPRRKLLRGHVVHRGPGFTLGRFECHPDDWLWREQNWIGDRAHLVFPQTVTAIEREDGTIDVGTPNAAILFRADETFRRRLIDPTGDYTFYIEVDEELADEILQDVGSSTEAAFSCHSVPIDAQTYALQWLTVHATTQDPNPASVSDEGIRGLIASVLTRTALADSTSSNGSSMKAVGEATELIAETLGRPLSLQEAASRVHVSPFHLTRLFRRYTGLPFHAFSLQIRLRSSLKAVLDTDKPLGDIAQDFGFVSHSHFTHLFRSAFGVTPSSVRKGETTPCDLCLSLGILPANYAGLSSDLS